MNKRYTKRKDDRIKEQQSVYEPMERFEIIHGVRYDFLASPSVVHQLVVSELNRIIGVDCQPNGVVLTAPMDVHLGDNTVQPDLIFIRNETLSIIQNQKIVGAPDLLVEILSPSTSKRDRSLKLALYESFGVSEYWIVDPLHATIEQFALDDTRRYTLRAVYGEGDTIDSDLLTCLRIDVDRLFALAKKIEHAGNKPE